MRIIGLLALCFVVIGATVAAGQVQFPRVERYELDADFYPSDARMVGQAMVFLSPDNTFGPEAVCYLHGELRVDSVTTAAGRIDFDQDQVFYNYEYSLVATEIRLRLTDTQRAANQGITLFYSGYFHPSRASAPSNYMRIDDDGVFLRSYGYSIWFPIFLPALQNDYPVTFAKVLIRTPADFRAVFVGNKIREWVEGDRRVSEWTAENVGLFDAQCTAQRFTITKEGNYYLYHYDDSISCAIAKNILQFAATVNTRFDEHYRAGAEGGQYHIMEMPRFGDISSANVTGITADTWLAFETDLRRKRYLGHELVHPFVDVPVARTDPLWCLAIEGFPSYFHLPILAELLGREWYDEYLGRIEKSYLEKKETGKNWRGNPLPPEKPLLQISPEEFSSYKDEFVLADRALLFLNNLYQQVDREAFYAFTTELFNRESLDVTSFRSLIGRHFPAAEKDLELWLNSTDYPERLRLLH